MFKLGWLLTLISLFENTMNIVQNEEIREKNMRGLESSEFKKLPSSKRKRKEEETV